MHLFKNVMLLTSKLHNKKYTEFEQKSFVRVALQIERMFLLRENGSEYCGLTVTQFLEALFQYVMETVHTCLGLPLRQC